MEAVRTMSLQREAVLRVCAAERVLPKLSLVVSAYPKRSEGSQHHLSAHARVSFYIICECSR